MDKSQLYDFKDTDRMTVPKEVANVIKGLLKQGETSPEIERVYEIIREEMPNYLHKDNSNARKIITRRNINGIIRKLPVAAYTQIIQHLGIASGKFMQGKQLDLITNFVNDSFKAD